MKKLLILLLLLSDVAFAIPGKYEFSVKYEKNEDMIIIHDGRNMLVLIEKGGYIGKSYQCGKFEIKDNKSSFGENKVEFFSEYALLNNKKYYYKEKKTDLFSVKLTCKI